MEGPKERWIGQDAGALVRPYTLTRGRTRLNGIRFDLVTILVAAGDRRTSPTWLSNEHRRLFELCRTPATVADLTSDMDLPLKVVHILLADLCEKGLLQEATPARGRPARPDAALLTRVLEGLQDL
ncbi:DUF742 domain-containing protein [Actinocorallia longicatena]|uniref:DUF742 domain-containing protein n=1 Tax=Actinocorallia longicatena TaxID=111803 RepID=A0ABP6QG54_9ACTN